jgi:hypothetical protein
MNVSNKHPILTDDEVRAALHGLPEPGDYEVIVTTLRYRTQPRVSAYTIFEDRSITIQVPEPFHPFGEVVPYGAKRIAAKGMKFVPLSEGVTFGNRSELIRFLYCHEWYHWYLHEIRGTKSAAETACDRFALRNYRKRTVTMDDADASFRRR